LGVVPLDFGHRLRYLPGTEDQPFVVGQPVTDSPGPPGRGEDGRDGGGHPDEGEDGDDPAGCRAGPGQNVAVERVAEHQEPEDRPTKSSRVAGWPGRGA